MATQMRASFVAALILTCGGCKTAPVTHPETFVPFVLIERGSEPRLPLRYEVPAGTTTRSSVTFGVTTTGKETATRFILGLRNSTLSFVAGPTESTANGVRFPFEVVDARPGPNAGKLSQEDEDWAKSLIGAAAIIEIDARGNVVWSETNGRAAKMPVRTRLAIITTIFGLTQVVLPEEPVGLGAKWQTRAWIAMLNFRSLQVMTYTWRDQIDGKLVIELEYEESGEPQRVDFVGERTPIAVESVVIDATGRVLLDLNALVSNATGEGKAKEELVVEKDGASQQVDVEEEFSITVSSDRSQPTASP